MSVYGLYRLSARVPKLAVGTVHWSTNRRYSLGLSETRTEIPKSSGLSSPSTLWNHTRTASLRHVVPVGNINSAVGRTVLTMPSDLNGPSSSAYSTSNQRWLGA